MRVVLSGGGTAGHIFPTLAVARRLCERLGADHADITIVCGSRELDRTLYRDSGFDRVEIKARGIVGVGVLRLPWRLWRLASSTVAVWRELGRRPPDVIVASGGYVSAPVLLAGRLRRIRAVLFSGDAQLGLATRVLAPLASVTTVAFKETASQVIGSRVEFTGYPLRAAFAAADGAAGRRVVGAGDDDFLVLVMGGSQGSHAINEAIRRDLARLVERAIVLHVGGRGSLPRLQSAREELPQERRARYQPRDFIDRGFANLIAGADLVVSRSGATSVAELSAVGTPAIIVPGRFGAGHQLRTAEALERDGAAVTISEDLLPSGRLAEAIVDLIDEPQRLDRMRQASRARGRPDAAGEIANLAIRLGEPAFAEATHS